MKCYLVCSRSQAEIEYVCVFFHLPILQPVMTALPDYFIVTVSAFA